MKYLNVCGIALFLMLGLLSCDKNENATPATLDVLIDKNQHTCAGGVSKIAIKSYDNWQASSDVEWISVSPTSGAACLDARDTIFLDVEPNTGDARTANIKISTLDKEKTIKITQKQFVENILQIDSLDTDISGYGLINKKLVVSAAEDWTLSSSEKWLTFNKTSGAACADAPIEIEMDVEINYYASRTATITLSSESLAPVEYVITQPKYTRPQTARRVGDPNAVFDMTKFVSTYKYNSQMLKWKGAGRVGGIPYLSEQMNKITKRFAAGTSAAVIKKYLEDNKYREIYVLLENGAYTFDTSVRVYSNAVLIGESRDGVVITVDPSIGKDHPITLYGASNAGVRNLTLHGGWLNADGNNYPKYKFTAAHNVQELKGDGMSGHTMINMKSSDDTKVSNCYADNVKIVNSASHPIVLRGKHITLRDIEIDGAFNKAGGCQGYLFLGGSECLITGCKVTNIRHISMQGGAVAYNVFYDNEMEQEFSFHTDDGGNNLIEFNRIYLRDDMHEGYNAIMGPWSSQHKVGGQNFIYNNRCKEDNGNRNGATPWSDEKLYMGPKEVSVGGDNPNRYINFAATPISDFAPGGTLYPIVLD